MNLYLISQDENNDFDTFDCAVVRAESEEEAARINPDGKGERWIPKDSYDTWAHSVEAVSVVLLGVALEGSTKGVVCASFNKG